MREALRESGTVTDAVYDAGFNSGGAASTPRRGKSSAWRPRRTGTAARASPSGSRSAPARSARSSSRRPRRGVCAIGLGDDPDVLVHDLEDRFPRADLVGGDPEFEALVARVIAFVEAPALGHDLPLDLRGTTFQQRVWRALRNVPAGTTATYGEIAERIGAPGGGPGGGARVRDKSARGRDPLPPGGPHGRRALRLPVGGGAKARPPRPRDDPLSAAAAPAAATPSASSSTTPASPPQLGAGIHRIDRKLSLKGNYNRPFEPVFSRTERASHTTPVAVPDGTGIP